MPSRCRSTALSLPLLACSALALAQPTPDAGRLLREQVPLAKPAEAPLRTPALPGPAASEPADEGPRVAVKGFVFSGATLVDDAELQAAMADAVGQSLSLGQLRARSTRITALYMSRGYLVRVVIPPQPAADGLLRLTLVEARTGQTRVSGDAALDTAWLQALASRQLPPGGFVTMPALTMAQSLVAEQPGVSSQATLAPGKGEGEVDLLLRVDRTPLARYFAQLNNNGDPATGRAQALGGVTLDNPTGSFDSARLLLSVTEGVRFVDAAYALPAGTSGLRVGAQASYLTYKERLTAASGNGSVFGLNASRPLLRRPSLQLGFTAGISRKRLEDSVAGLQTGDRRLTVASLGLDGTAAIAWPWPAVARGELTLLSGRLDLGANASAQATDQATRRSEGRFQTLNARLQHVTTLGGGWGFNTALRGQIADRNIDSSERFTLGGAQGVRAYPGHEGAGDQGWTLSLDLQRAMSEQLTLRAFVDHGQTRVNHRTWDGWNGGNPGQRNSYSLSGAGVGAEWRMANGVSAALTVANPLGHNPGRDIEGRDSDGRRSGVRSWVSLNFSL